MFCLSKSKKGKDSQRARSQTTQKGGANGFVVCRKDAERNLNKWSYQTKKGVRTVRVHLYGVERGGRGVLTLPRSNAHSELWRPQWQRERGQIGH